MAGSDVAGQRSCGGLGDVCPFALAACRNPAGCLSFTCLGAVGLRARPTSATFHFLAHTLDLCEYIWDEGLQSPRPSTLEYQRAFAVWSRSIRASRCTSDGTHHWPMRLRQSRGQSEVVNLLSPIVTLAHRGRP